MAWVIFWHRTGAWMVDVVWGWGMEGFPRNAGGNDGVSEMISQVDYGG